MKNVDTQTIAICAFGSICPRSSGSCRCRSTTNATTGSTSSNKYCRYFSGTISCNFVPKCEPTSDITIPGMPSFQST